MKGPLHIARRVVVVSRDGALAQIWSKPQNFKYLYGAAFATILGLVGLGQFVARGVLLLSIVLLLHYLYVVVSGGGARSLRSVESWWAYIFVCVPSFFLVWIPVLVLFSFPDREFGHLWMALKIAIYVGVGLTFLYVVMSGFYRREV